MPFANEHAARQRDPDDFVNIVELWSREGIRALGGRLKSDPEGETKTQAFRFKSDKFTPAEAKTWLEEHGHKFGDFEEATGETSNSTSFQDNHIAQIRDPALYDRFLPDFSGAVNKNYGIRIGEDGKEVSELQSIEFDPQQFSVEEVKAWLEAHDYADATVDPGKEPEGDISANSAAANFEGLRDIEVAHEGLYRDSKGIPRVFSSKNLDELVANQKNFGAELNPQIKVTHQGAVTRALIDFFGSETLGRVGELYRKGKSVFARTVTDVPKAFASLVGKTFTRFSPEFILNHKGQGLALAGHAFVTKPAIKDLARATPESVVSEFAKNAATAPGGPSLSRVIAFQEHEGEKMSFAEEEGDGPEGDQMPTQEEFDSLVAKVDTLAEEVAKLKEEPAAPAGEGEGEGGGEGGGSQNAAAFAEKVAEIVDEKLKPLVAKATGAHERLDEAAFEARRRRVSDFCKGLVESGRLSPAERERDEPILLSASDEIKVKVGLRDISQFEAIWERMARLPIRVRLGEGAGSAAASEPESEFSSLDEAARAEQAAALKEGKEISFAKGSSLAAKKFPGLAQAHSAGHRKTTGVAV